MRLILADHHPTILKALKTRLQEDTRFHIVGTAIDASGLIEQAVNTHPDIVLFDWGLPGRRKENLIDTLQRLEPCPYVIVMSSRIDVGRAALSAGADTFISKGEDSRWLIETLSEINVRSEGKRDEKPSAKKSKDGLQK